jgi:FAD/FMN-containing dehydrogenase
MEMAHWLIRLRIPNECFILNNTNLAAIMAKKWPAEYKKIKDTLPTWILFYVLPGFDYFPEERVSTFIDDVKEIDQQAGVESAHSVGRVSAFDLLQVVQAPSDEPYWKLRPKGSCHDIMCISNFQAVEKITGAMADLANDAGYPATEMGVYIQPIVQGCNFHTEFNLFYDGENATENACVRKLATLSINALMAKGAHFSRPYGENTRTIMNKDAASVAALHRVKGIVDPENIMNPGKLCF